MSTRIVRVREGQEFPEGFLWVANTWLIPDFDGSTTGHYEYDVVVTDNSGGIWLSREDADAVAETIEWLLATIVTLLSGNPHRAIDEVRSNAENVLSRLRATRQGAA